MAEVPDPTLPGEDTFDYGPVHDNRPPLWRPYNQGDIFEGIELPGLERAGDHSFAMIFMHPCTMRTGVQLRPLVTMIQVHKHETKKANERLELWDNLNKVMPLPKMMGSGGDAYVGDFMSLTSVQSKELQRDRRVASLTLDGRNQFQQRVIFHLTRFAPKVAELRLAARQLEYELDLQTEWMGTWAYGSEEDLDVIAAGEQAFEDFMIELDRNPAHARDTGKREQIPRRALLNQLEFTAVTRAMHARLEDLFPGR